MIRVEKDKNYKVGEVLRLLGVSKQTLHNWCKRGWIRKEKGLVGSFVSGSELQNFIDWKLKGQIENKEVEKVEVVEVGTVIEPVEKVKSDKVIPRFDFDRIFRNWGKVLSACKEGKIDEKEVVKYLNMGRTHYKLNRGFTSLGSLYQFEVERVLENPITSRVDIERRFKFYSEAGKVLVPDLKF